MSRTLTHKEFLERFNNKNLNDKFEVLSQYKGHREKMFFKCKECNYSFSCTANNMLKGNYGCPECAKYKRKNSDYLKKLTGNIEKVKNKINELYPDGDYTLLSTEYKNNKAPLDIKCNNCGYEFKISYVNLCKGKGCKYCNQPSKHNSKGVQKIRKYLKENKYSFEEEFIISDCKNIKPLPFDFKININDDLFILLEFDGEFHERNKMNNDALKLQQKRDEIKNKYCKNNNLNLLRINYKNYKDIEKILDEYLNEVQRLSKPNNKCNSSLENKA